jgi:hypothetical protein
MALVDVLLYCVWIGTYGWLNPGAVQAEVIRGLAEAPVLDERPQGPH